MTEKDTPEQDNVNQDIDELVSEFQSIKNSINTTSEDVLNASDKSEVTKTIDELVSKLQGRRS